VLDPRGTSTEEKYRAVEEHSQLGKTCLCITSGSLLSFSTASHWIFRRYRKGPHGTLSHRIYQHGECFGLVDNSSTSIHFRSRYSRRLLDIIIIIIISSYIQGKIQLATLPLVRQSGGSNCSYLRRLYAMSNFGFGRRAFRQSLRLSGLRVKSHPWCQS